MKMTIAATRAPISGRANSRLDRLRVTRFEASEGAVPVSVLRGVLMTAPALFDVVGAGLVTRPGGRAAGVRLHERKDRRDVRLVDERRPGEDGLATAHDVAV